MCFFGIYQNDDYLKSSRSLYQSSLIIGVNTLHHVSKVFLRYRCRLVSVIRKTRRDGAVGFNDLNISTRSPIEMEVQIHSVIIGEVRLGSHLLYDKESHVTSAFTSKSLVYK